MVVEMGQPRFHVKHVDTGLYVIVEACGRRRTVGGAEEGMLCCVMTSECFECRDI